MRQINGIFIVVILLLGAVALHAALPFLFWLPSAKRENKNDPKSDLFFPTSTINTTPAGTSTTSPTPSITKTNSPSPSNSPTANGTFTFSPMPTFTRTTSPTPSQTPTFTATPTTGSVVNTVLYDDFEANPPCGFYQYDDLGTNMSFTDPTQDFANFKNGAASYASTYQSCTIWGAGFGFLPMGCAASVIDARALNPTYVYIWVKTDQPLSFYFTISEDPATTGDVEEHWSNATPVSVLGSPSWQLVEAPVSDFIPNDYFHNVLGNPLGNGVFDAAAANWDIQYGADAASTFITFYLDDAGFADGSQAAPVPPITGTTLVFNGETGISSGPSFPGAGATSSADAGTGCVINPSPILETAGGSNLAGGSPGNAMCINGTMAATGPPYGWSLWNQELIAGGGNLSIPGVSITPAMAPNSRLLFSYKSSFVTPFSIMVQFVSTNITDYAYYAYQFPVNRDGLWHQLIVYFPDGAGVPKFSQLYGTPVSWNPGERQTIGSVQFSTVPQAGVPTNFDICIDDIYFD